MVLGFIFFNSPPPPPSPQVHQPTPTLGWNSSAGGKGRELGRAVGCFGLRGKGGRGEAPTAVCILFFKY